MKKKRIFLLLCLCISLSACGRVQNNSDLPESGSVETEYLKYGDFLVSMPDEEKMQMLEQEIKDTLTQIDGIADAEVSVLRPDSGYEVSVHLIYDAEAQDKKTELETQVKNHLNTVFAGAESLTLNIR